MSVEALASSRPGLMWPTRSTAASDPASDRMLVQVCKYLLESYVVARPTEKALGDLDEVRGEASHRGWDGYGAEPVNLSAYMQAETFLKALPNGAPVPEIGADSEGDIVLDWNFGLRRALTVRVGPSGRCTFAWIRGRRSHRGTEWLDEGIPVSILEALGQLAAEAPRAREAER